MTDQRHELVAERRSTDQSMHQHQEDIDSLLLTAISNARLDGYLGMALAFTQLLKSENTIH